MIGRLGVVGDHGGGDPDLLSHLVTNWPDLRRCLAVRAHVVGEVERLASGHLADAVAVRVLVAGVLEDLARLVEVEVEDLVGGDVGRPARVG